MLSALAVRLSTIYLLHEEVYQFRKLVKLQSLFITHLLLHLLSLCISCPDLSTHYTSPLNCHFLLNPCKIPLAKERRVFLWNFVNTPISGTCDWTELHLAHCRATFLKEPIPLNLLYLLPCLATVLYLRYQKIHGCVP